MSVNEIRVTYANALQDLRFEQIPDVGVAGTGAGDNVRIVGQNAALDVIVVGLMALVLGQQPARLAVEQAQRTVLAASQEALLVARLRQIGDRLANLVAGQLAHAYVIVAHTAVQRGGKDLVLVGEHRSDAIACLLHHLHGIQAAGAYVPAHDRVVTPAGYRYGGVLVKAHATHAAGMAAQTTHRCAWGEVDRYFIYARS